MTEREIKIEPVAIPTPSERDWLLIEAGYSPVKWMTRDEFAKRYLSE